MTELSTRIRIAAAKVKKKPAKKKPVKKKPVKKKPVKKKPAKGKFTTPIENAFDAIHDYWDGKQDEGNTRVTRLLMRLKNSLITEGYPFDSRGPSTNTLPALSMSTPHRRDNPGSTDPVRCVGALCTLLPNHPVAGLTKADVELLVSKFNSRQCYRYTLTPADKSKVRKSGNNKCLPKPITWSKMGQNNVEIDAVEYGEKTLEEFRVSGIRSYSFDRKTFYVSNSGMCTRWCSSLNRIVSTLLGK